LGKGLALTLGGPARSLFLRGDAAFRGDCRSYGGGFFVNEYGPSTNLDPSDPSYRANDVWMRPLGEFKTLERAKAAALEYYKSRTTK
jgi:hypothetical protein